MSESSSSRFARRSLLVGVGGVIGAIEAPAASATTASDPPAISLAKFEPAGNGTVDDWSKVNAAIEESIRTKSILVIPGGTYAISRSLVVTGATIVMEHGATIKILDGVAPPTIMVATGAFSVSGPGVLDGKGAASGNGRGISLVSDQPWSAVYIADITIKRCRGRGIDVSYTGTLDSRPTGEPANIADILSNSITLENVRVEGCGDGGIAIKQVRGVRIRGGSANANALWGWLINRCSDVRAEGLAALRNGDHGIATMYSDNVEILSPTAQWNVRHGVVFGGGDPNERPSKDLAIIGGDCSGNHESGVDFDLTIGTDKMKNGEQNPDASKPIRGNFRVVGVHAEGNKQHGILVTKTTHGVVSGCIATGNTINGVSLNSTKSCIVEGNEISDNKGYGLTMHKNAKENYDIGYHVVGQNNWSNNALGNVSSDGNPAVTFNVAPVVAVKARDTGLSRRTTPQADPELKARVDLRATYSVNLYLAYSAATASDLRLGWLLPTGARLSWTPNGLPSNVSGNAGAIARAVYDGSGTAALGGAGAGKGVSALVTGTLVTGTAGGDLRVRWSQLVSGSSATIVSRMSSLTVVRVG